MDGTQKCPFCGETIQAAAVLCRFCRQRLDALPGPAVAGGSAPVQSRVDAILRKEIPSVPPGPGTLTAVTWVCLILTPLAAVAGIAAGLGARDKGCLASGLIVAGISFLVFLAGLAIDLATPAPRTRTTPERALKAFYGALRRRSYVRAYACLSPIDRTSAVRTTVPIERLSVQPQDFAFDSQMRFAAYWRAQAGASTAFLGGYHKSFQYTLGEIEEIGPDLAMGRVKMRMSGYPAWTILGILGGVLPAALLIVIFTRRESFEMRKMVVRKDGLWWIVNGEFSGDGDEALERALVRRSPEPGTTA